MNPWGTESEVPGRLGVLTKTLGRLHDLDRLRELSRPTPGDRGRKEVRRAIRRRRGRQADRLDGLLRNHKILHWASESLVAHPLDVEWTSGPAAASVEPAPS